MKRSSWRTLLAVVLVGALCAVAGRYVVAQLQAGAQSDEAMFRLVKARATARDETVKQLTRDDAITCVLVGTSSPIPSPPLRTAAERIIRGDDDGDRTSNSAEGVTGRRNSEPLIGC